DAEHVADECITGNGQLHFAVYKLFTLLLLKGLKTLDGAVNAGQRAVTLCSRDGVYDGLQLFLHHPALLYNGELLLFLFLSSEQPGEKAAIVAVNRSRDDGARISCNGGGPSFALGSDYFTVGTRFV